MVVPISPWRLTGGFLGSAKRPFLSRVHDISPCNQMLMYVNQGAGIEMEWSCQAKVYGAGKPQNSFQTDKFFQDYTQGQGQ